MIRSIQFIFLVILFSTGVVSAQRYPGVVTGADQIDRILKLTAGKKIALYVNQTAMSGKTHLADTLKKRGSGLVKIFSPEHGFRGLADAGEDVASSIDAGTGLPIVSLYGPNKKPKPEFLTDVDVVIFDMQDVGVRFFTYISSLHYMMEACAEQKKMLIILDRPNPNSGYVDGPVLKKEFKSFVGMHTVPIAHGMSIGEYGKMVNGEGWLENGIKCDLEVVEMKYWKHGDRYAVPVRPSPNLPNDHAIQLYPFTCLFEGTVLSLGRGTMNPFELIGHPDLKSFEFTFTPVGINGMAKHPLLENQLCHGLDLRQAPVPGRIDLSYLIQLYQAFPDKDKFFISYFEKLAGTDELRRMIRAGKSEEEIRASWQADLDQFKKIRAKYLIYP